LSNSRTVLVSCHIPKTGGTSFRRLLQKHHGDRLVLLTRMPQSQPVRRELFPLLRRNYWYARSIDSHDLRYVPPVEFWPGARFAIILRDPVERFLSFYFFRRHHTGLALQLKDPSEIERRLERDFPPFSAFLEQFAEYQTRFLAWASFFKPADRSTLEEATKALNYYDYIGFTECSDALPNVIGHDFPELRGTTLPLENVTPRRASSRWQDQLGSEPLRQVREKHDLDLRLYEAAIELNLQRGHPVPS
jgi:hypothetical protein